MRVWLIALALFMLSPSVSFAKCGTGNQPGYDDITAVMLTSRYRASDGYRARWDGIKALRDSTYWAFFWDASPTRYSQYNLVGGIGSYELSIKLSDAVRILQNNAFFELSNRELGSDGPQLVLSVLRCSTVTRLIVYDDPLKQDAAVAKLFDDFAALIETSPKVQTSVVPAGFKETLLFDP
jgi:hypothetical protein